MEKTETQKKTWKVKEVVSREAIIIFMMTCSCSIDVEYEGR